MNTINRRKFLKLAGAAGLAATTASASLPSLAAQAAKGAAKHEDFTFLFITDTHIQPELDASAGCAMAFKKAREIKSDFAIQGGDHVFDSLAVTKARATSLFDLYGKTEQDLGLKLYHTIGNHDCFGVLPASGASQADPLYGKKMFEERFGKTYYSFDHKGVHFIVLDTIGFTEDRAYEGRVDAAQVKWLAADLKALPRSAPVIVSVHMPLVTAFDSYVPVPAEVPKHHAMSVINSSEVIALFEGHNILGVLQGHTHINEEVEWHGVRYFTSGAVSGNWWRGTRMGTPEGFTVAEVRGGKLSTRYETYGFKSVDPNNT